MSNAETPRPLEVVALEKAISVAGGPAELARFITENYAPITAQAICDWKRCPPLRVLQVEAATWNEATGRPIVTRHELRPDLYPVQEQAA